MTRVPKENDSLSIERLLRESKEKRIAGRRKVRLDRFKFADWGIWKLLRITWR